MFKKDKSQKALDVDVRFLLANERTLLAWVRTGLTLIAGGVAIAFIANDSLSGMLAGIGAILFGGLLAIIGFIRYKLADKAIREGQLPDTGIGGLVVVIGVIIFSIILVVMRGIGIG